MTTTGAIAEDESQLANENAQLWVDALRSGRFAQIQQHLQDQKGYCCLGVACEIYIEQGNILPKRYNRRFRAWEYDGVTTLLPETVKAWLGLNNASGDFVNNSLIRLNDDRRTFTEIADVIESAPPGLFQWSNRPR